MEAAARKELAGMRILVVEDEMLIAMLLEDMLQELGCTVVGPVSRVQDALTTIGQDRLDGALLDANLDGESSSPAADELLRQGVPFLLATGYGERADDPPALKDAPRLRKPFDFEQLANRMTDVFVNAPRSGVAVRG